MGKSAKALKRPSRKQKELQKATRPAARPEGGGEKRPPAAAAVARSSGGAVSKPKPKPKSKPVRAKAKAKAALGRAAGPKERKTDYMDIFARK
ncbi:hypothetical protein H4R18_002884 [Coemansia javaensis]|uniref:Uncharacterized protein n=1 Tax=Coemansia javaensis TaxID=2761396 RepID=A0A9W8LI37_9FUNG|nr:hypothetical protein H4R18_002884 [Coemansia javaensis]